MPRSSSVPVGSSYHAGTQTWTIAFDPQIVEIPAAPDLTDWGFRRGILWVYPDSVALDRGRLQFVDTTFDGSETHVRYDGGPPYYYDLYHTILDAFSPYPISP